MISKKQLNGFATLLGNIFQGAIDNSSEEDVKRCGVKISTDETTITVRIMDSCQNLWFGEIYDFAGVFDDDYLLEVLQEIEYDLQTFANDSRVPRNVQHARNMTTFEKTVCLVSFRQIAKEVAFRWNESLSIVKEVLGLRINYAD